MHFDVEKHLTVLAKLAAHHDELAARFLGYATGDDNWANRAAEEIANRDAIQFTIAALHGLPKTGEHGVSRDMAGEGYLGMRVAAYRWPLPRPADITQEAFDDFFKGSPPHKYAEHWSTGPEGAERLFTEASVRRLISRVQNHPNTAGGVRKWDNAKGDYVYVYPEDAE